MGVENSGCASPPKRQKQATIQCEVIHVFCVKYFQYHASVLVSLAWSVERGHSHEDHSLPTTEVGRIPGPPSLSPHLFAPRSASPHPAPPPPSPSEPHSIHRPALRPARLEHACCPCTHACPSVEHSWQDSPTPATHHTPQIDPYLTVSGPALTRHTPHVVYPYVCLLLLATPYTPHVYPYLPPITMHMYLPAPDIPHTASLAPPACTLPHAPFPR